VLLLPFVVISKLISQKGIEKMLENFSQFPPRLFSYFRLSKKNSRGILKNRSAAPPLLGLRPGPGLLSFNASSHIINSVIPHPIRVYLGPSALSRALFPLSDSSQTPDCTSSIF
jgi:hypothetical protein